MAQARKRHKKRKSAVARTKKPIDKIEAKAKMCAPKTAVSGRPTSYSPQFNQAIIEFMARGYSLTAFAGSIGVCRDTIYEWAEKFPQFSDALTKARAARTLYWERRLQIAGPDARAVIFALRNACSDEWRSEPEVAVTVHNETTVDTSKPPEEWGEAELRAELERRGAVPQNGNGKSNVKVKR